MSSLTISSDLAVLLGQLKEPTELRDTAGDPDALWTPEEAERLWEEQRDLPWSTLEEFWRKTGRFESTA